MREKFRASIFLMKGKEFNTGRAEAPSSRHTAINVRLIYPGLKHPEKPGSGNHF
jgi:hypothetical protein